MVKNSNSRMNPLRCDCVCVCVYVCVLSGCDGVCENLLLSMGQRDSLLTALAADECVFHFACVHYAWITIYTDSLG